VRGRGGLERALEAALVAIGSYQRICTFVVELKDMDLDWEDIDGGRKTLGVKVV